MCINTLHMTEEEAKLQTELEYLQLDVSKGQDTDETNKRIEEICYLLEEGE